MIVIKKKIFLVILSSILVVSSCFTPALANSEISVYLTSDYGTTMQKVDFSDVQPAIISQRVLIPVRGVFEELECSVTWDQNTSTAVIKSKTKDIQIPLNASYIIVNDKKISIDVPAQVINSRIVIPIRAVSEALGLKVEWNASNNSVIIHKNYYYEYGDFGSAGYIQDKTIIVSIFTTDSETSWDFSDKEQSDLANKTCDNIGIATNWINQNLKAYNAETEFIYDWREDDALVYSVRFYQPLVTSDGENYFDQINYINKHVDTQGILEKYGAQNIIYMFFFNTPYSNPHNPWSIYKKYNDNFKTEIINIYNKFDNEFLSNPSVYAHEIMHCFGAKDLYYSNEYISQAYVDWCKQTHSNDIMYTVNSGEKIFSSFSELDAYYMGLLKTCNDAINWGLKDSDYVTLQKFND